MQENTGKINTRKYKNAETIILGVNHIFNFVQNFSARNLGIQQLAFIAKNKPWKSRRCI